ncbi:protein kinase domain-containing protein [Georgenia sp. Z1491]|uniref:serine/threonine-protein kinase n=1 Tax=Georgenia sp. Z1491 TaxID=3416707 RepID=UPI003CF88324
MTSRPLGSRYTLDRQVGKGAMGAVWAGHRNEDGKQVAVKILRSEYADDAEIVHRFIQERSFLVRVLHENVVQVHDLVVEGSTLAIVMEYVPGGDLRGLLDERGTLPPGEACWYGRLIARGLEAIHGRGVIHRDVKPGNVLLAEGGADGTMVPKVSDFGVARVTQALHATTSTAMLGTPLYMAPEIIEEEPPGPATDVYALGVMLYEMVVGVTPFAGPGGTYGVLRRHSENLPGRPEGFPDQLWTAVGRMVAKDAADRPGAADVAEELGHLAEELRGLPALGKLDAPPPGPTAPRRPQEDGTTDLGRRTAAAATGGDETRQVDPALVERVGEGQTRIAPAGQVAPGPGMPAQAAPGPGVPGHGTPGQGEPAQGGPAQGMPGQAAPWQAGPGAAGQPWVGPGATSAGSPASAPYGGPGPGTTGQVYGTSGPSGPGGPGGPGGAAGYGATGYGGPGAAGGTGTGGSGGATRSRMPVIIGGALVALLVVVLVVWLVFLRGGETPDLTGQTVEQAQSELGGADIVPTQVLADGQAVGTIVGQEPAAGETHHGTVEVEVAQPSTRLYLESLEEPADGESYGYPRTDAVQIAGENFPYGILTSAGRDADTLAWDLDGGFRTFIGTIGRWDDENVLPDEEAAFDARVVRVQVIGDGATLWSGEVTLSEAVELELDVTGVDVLQVAFTSTDGGPATLAIGDGRVLAVPDEVPSMYQDM